MEERTEIALLLDFYGQLLTPRQFEILDLHYNSDCSLGEIAGQLDISRQGVYDSVKKGKELLQHYEDKLGLVKRFSRHGQTLKNVLENLKAIQTQSEGEQKQRIQECVQKLEKVMNEL